MAQVTLTIKLDLPALHKELQEAVNKIKAKLSEVGNVDVDFDLDGLQKDLNKVKDQFGDVDKSTKGVKGNLREAGLELVKWIGIAQMVRGAFNFLIDSKNVARDAAEIQSKFDTVFSHLKVEANAWAENFSKSVGRAKSDVKSWMAELQDTFVPLGYTRTKAAELSESLVKLAVDVASFNNASDPEVIRDFTSALVGNHETVRKYGILITENSLKQEADNSGIKKKFDSLTELEKVQLRYNIILKSTTDAQGDAIRTADSLANQEKRQAAELKNMQEQLGTKVVPAFLLVTKATMGWINVLNELLGVKQDVIDKMNVEATQMEELRTVYNKYPKDFEAYRKTLESEVKLRMLGAIATLEQARTQALLIQEYKKSLGIQALFFNDSELDKLKEEIKDQEKVVATYKVQLETIKNFNKQITEEAGTTTKEVVGETTKAVKLSTENAYQYLMDLDKQANEILMRVNQQSLKYEQDAIKGLRLHSKERQSFLEAWNKSSKKFLEDEKKDQLDHLKSIQQDYAEHFDAILDMAQYSTKKRGDFEKALTAYALNLLKQYLANYLATKIAEKTIHESTETEKTAATETGVVARLALMAMEIVKSLAVAAASIVQAIASGIAWLFATLGPFAIPVIGGMVAATIGLFNGLKKTLGFKRGGYTGSGPADEEAGPAHKGEYYFEKNLVDKEPSNYAVLHKLLRAGYTLSDILLGAKKFLNPITEAPMALAGLNLGSVTPTSSAFTNSNSKLESLLLSMDDRLRKIEEKTGKVQIEGKLKADIENRKLAIAVELGQKDLDKEKANA